MWILHKFTQLSKLRCTTFFRSCLRQLVISPVVVSTRMQKAHSAQFATVHG